MGGSKTRYKMEATKILFLALFAVSAINADKIYRIEVRTADCDDCGMSNTFGDLRMQICNGFKECCNTAELDNTFHNDFEGSDGYQADYIKVGTDTGYYQCNFIKFLDGDD